MDTYRLFNGLNMPSLKQMLQWEVQFLLIQILSPYALTAIENTNLAEGVSTDWQDLLLTTGIRTGHDLM